MARKSRSAAAAARAARTPTPQPQGSDEEMHDAPQSDGENPDNELPEQESTRYDDEEEAEEEERIGTPVNDSDSASHVSTPGRGQRGSALRKRRAGRPPRTKNLERDTPDDSAAASDKGTPRKRGGFRGGPRGSGFGRWGKQRGPGHTIQIRTDVHNDEVDVAEDPEGEAKVDKSGNLLGDREYRVRVFTIIGKENRLYMLSTEPARCIGFRDSYLFFQKHPNLFKIILDDEAKRDLIARDLIPHSYKGRAIGVVTARSVFREFGARIVIGGKKVVDDYQVAAAKARGEVEGELVVPEDQIPAGGKHLYDKNQYVAWHGASSVYHTGQPSIPIINGKGGDGKKRKIIVTGDNWMFEHAQAASRYNSMLASERRQASNGVYDIHTNVMQYPRNTQPTHARWERVSEVERPAISGQRDCGLVHVNGVNGSSSSNIADGVDGDSATVSRPQESEDTIFRPVPLSISRNFMVNDIVYVSPAMPDMPFPGPDGEIMDEFDTSLSSIPRDLIDLLDEQQRRDFLEARNVERGWKTQWKTEREDKLRGELHISYNT